MSYHNRMCTCKDTHAVDYGNSPPFMHHLHRYAEDDLGDEVSEEMDIPADQKSEVTSTLKH